MNYNNVFKEFLVVNNMGFEDSSFGVFVLLGFIGTSVCAGTLNYHLDKSNHRVAVKNICEKVNYAHPDSVETYLASDINKDGITDFILTLKDGDKLEYMSKGYDVSK